MSQQRSVIVTGSSRGIGAATAKRAAAEGYEVCINPFESVTAAEALAQEITDQGGKAIVVPGDVSKEETVMALFARCDRELAPLAGLVNNAGISGPVCKLEEVEAEALHRVFAVNVVGAFLCAREAIKRLSTRQGGTGGSIVNVSSRAAALGGPNEWIHYAASKGAIDSMTIGLSKEVGGEGIRVNAVNPGLIETEIHERAGLPDRLDRLVGQVPMARSGSAEEVAETICWLLSPSASYINGALVPVSGGR